MRDYQGQLRSAERETNPVALLVIDMINDLEFDDGERLLEQALPAARRTAALKRAARHAGIPTIYVNDNFGQWRSDFNHLVAHCLEDGVRGRPIAEMLVPEKDDYFVLKPKHSGFYSTSLNVLLRSLEAGTLILTGLATDMCVLFTACDAHMRGYPVVVPADCVAASTPEDSRHALALMQKAFSADVTPSDRLDLAAVIRAASTSAA
jgi:nicotinamidase-related amidase